MNGINTIATIVNTPTINSSTIILIVLVNNNLNFIAIIYNKEKRTLKIKMKNNNSKI